MRLSLGDVTKVSRRKTLIEAGITKAKPRGVRRRMTFNGLGGEITRPLDPTGDLLHDVEEIIQDQSFRQDHTPKKRRPSHINRDALAVSTYEGPRAWAKPDWKRLDACLTEERQLLATLRELDEGTLADPYDVQTEDVVARFVSLAGGWEVLNRLGGSWTR